MCQNKPERKNSKYAAVHNYVTGDQIDHTDKDTFDLYKKEIDDCDIGAVFGDDYGYDGIIYMIEV